MHVYIYIYTYIYIHTHTHFFLPARGNESRCGRAGMNSQVGSIPTNKIPKVAWVHLSALCQKRIGDWAVLRTSSEFGMRDVVSKSRSNSTTHPWRILLQRRGLEGTHTHMPHRCDVCLYKTRLALQCSHESCHTPHTLPHKLLNLKLVSASYNFLPEPAVWSVTPSKKTWPYFFPEVGPDKPSGAAGLCSTKSSTWVSGRKILESQNSLRNSPCLFWNGVLTPSTFMASWEVFAN